MPGFVLTPLNRRLQDDPARVAALADRTLVGRNGVPDDFAGAAVFLASRASAYVTGQSPTSTAGSPCTEPSGAAHWHHLSRRDGP